MILIATTSGHHRRSSNVRLLLLMMMLMVLCLTTSITAALQIHKKNNNNNNDESTKINLAPVTKPPKKLNAGHSGKITIISNNNALNQQQTVAAKDEHAKVEEERRKKNMEDNLKKTAAARAKLLHEETEKRKNQEGFRRERKSKERKSKKARQDAIERKKKQEEKRRKYIEKTKNDQKQAAENESKKRAAQKKAEKVRKECKRKEKSRKSTQEKAQKRTLMKMSAGWKAYNDGYSKLSVEVWPKDRDDEDKLCFLSGLVKGSKGSIATLPKICRPNERLIFNVMMSNKDARVDILPDGRVYFIVGGGSSEKPWLSLDGKIFPANMKERHAKVEFADGWSNFGYHYAPLLLYAHTFDTEHGRTSLCLISGLVRGNHWADIGHVDDECRPKDGRTVFSLNNHEHSTRVDVLPNGLFTFSGGYHNHGWVSTSNLLWSADAGVALHLNDEWHPCGHGYREPAYQRLGRGKRRMCMLTGLIKSSNWKKPIATLPPPCRPSKTHVFGLNTHTNSVRVDVLTSGEIRYVSGHHQWRWLSLEGIHFLVDDK